MPRQYSAPAGTGTEIDIAFGHIVCQRSISRRVRDRLDVLDEIAGPLGTGPTTPPGNEGVIDVAASRFVPLLERTRIDNTKNLPMRYVFGDLKYRPYDESATA